LTLQTSVSSQFPCIENQNRVFVLREIFWKKPLIADGGSFGVGLIIAKALEFGVDNIKGEHPDSWRPVVLFVKMSRNEPV